ncbi:PREDICTED: uncharacterized protein LOC105452631 isoform X2 [Wasmannia auropunctata]|uniref:uncharacterized protein LOC105452631 isoform X2 n=1 Tax=Wasmannia auropunctata TaxID=64793 RepID=UPI0005EFA0B2|nr:PREDICTED: uncharacterized protein LOC105452631 isoform X2 [Wasmannia auropunctata]
MNARRILPFLLLVICIINGIFSDQNDWSRPNNIRHIRKLSEYLVPPPPSRFHPDRIPRLAKFPPTTPKPEYFKWLMRWLNPFSPESVHSSQPPPPPPLRPPRQSGAPYPQYIQPPPLPPVTYNGPPPVDYEKPPLPLPSANDHSGYPAPIKARSCNSCNKVPWMPIQHDELAHPGDASYGPPPLESPGGEHRLPKTHEIPPDPYHAASQEIRVPDFSFAQPGGQDGSFIPPIPYPQLFLGTVPPLHEAQDFNAPVINPQVPPDGNSGYNLPPPPVFPENGAPIDNGSYMNVPGPTFNNGHNGPPMYPDPSNLGVGAVPPVYSGPPDQGVGAVPPMYSGPPYQGVGAVPPVYSGPPNFNVPQELGYTNPGGDMTGTNGSPGGQINQNPPSYGTSDFAQVPNNYNPVPQDNYPSSSANVAEGSYAPLHTLDGSSGTNGDSIHFEQSPSLDFTHRDESWTHSSSIPSTSNVFTGFQSPEIAGTTVAPGNEIFGMHQGVAPAESHPPTNYFNTFDNVAKETNIHNNANRGIDGESNNNGDITQPYDNVTEETFSDVNVNYPDQTSEQQNANRKQQMDLQRNTTAGEFNHADNYVGEESINRFKVISPPNSSHILQPWPPTLATFEDTMKKLVDTKTNNSIDVHKLQKNIDNWTIQEYSKGTTVSTISPNSSKPYLFPSKKIPNEFFMTTKPVNYATDSHTDNVKTFTLSGFSFNDHEYKGSASNHMENLTISPINASTASDENMWRDYPVGISADRERVYIVTPQPSVTPSGPSSEYRQEKVLKEAERNRQESKKTAQTDAKKTKKSDTFESIEKAYQVLPQAVNNLAVASTGPESVPLWGIMEHSDFASSVDSEYDNNDTEPPALYSRLPKKSSARR